MAREEFQYALLQVVPSIERGERINAGVVLFCRRQQFLAARIELDRERLAALAPAADADEVARHLETFVQVAAGEPAAGTVAALPDSQRFHWLVAPSSTMIQCSPVHTGLSDDPQGELERLRARLVR